MGEYAKAIKRWVDEEKKEGRIHIVRFYISPQRADVHIYEDVIIREVLRKFENSGIGVTSIQVDSVNGSFNLNRGFIETDEFDAIIEFGGVYPVDMNPEDSAWLSELDDAGLIRIVVFIKKGDRLVLSAI